MNNTRNQINFFGDDIRLLAISGGIVLCGGLIMVLAIALGFVYF